MRFETCPESDLPGRAYWIGVTWASGHELFCMEDGCQQSA